MKKCNHGNEDWRRCSDCLDEVEMQLAIARSYLHELAEGKFNDNGVMTVPVAEPVQGLDFQQIAARGWHAIL